MTAADTGSSLALLTDFYQMTMAYGYWKAGLDQREAVFHLFFRNMPFKGGFTVAAGLEAVVHFLQRFRFTPTDLHYLASLRGADETPHFPEKFLRMLEEVRFTGHIDAMPEGSVAFPYEPLLRIQAPLLQCQLLETPLLNLINFPTLIATKAARMCLAAQGEPLLEFGMRRAQGIDGALTASRAAYIGGCEATSNLLAGKQFGIPVRGTHSHSWIMVFEDELEAFHTYASHLPNHCVFLVDTYHTLEGVKKAIEVGKWLRQRGKRLLGIRLDSGDLADLSIKSRAMLDEAGFNDTVIVASNELDETLISELKRQGAHINVWGVGTNLVTGKDQPALDGVYKLSAIRDATGHWQYKLKLSEQMAKISNPGVLQVKRFSKQGVPIADVLYHLHAPWEGDCHAIDPFNPLSTQLFSKEEEAEELLVPIMRGGQCVYSLPALSAIRARTQAQLARFPIGMKRFINPQTYFVGMEKQLYDLKVSLMQQARHVAQPLTIP